MDCDKCTNKDRDAFYMVQNKETRAFTGLTRCLYWTAAKKTDVFIGDKVGHCPGYTESYDSDREVSGLLEEK